MAIRYPPEIDQEAAADQRAGASSPYMRKARRRYGTSRRTMQGVPGRRGFGGGRPRGLSFAGRGRSSMGIGPGASSRFTGIGGTEPIGEAQAQYVRDYVTGGPPGQPGGGGESIPRTKAGYYMTPGALSGSLLDLLGPRGPR